MSAQKKVRWGIISTANIGMEKVTPGIMKSAHSEVAAICSRDLATAQAAAKRLGIAKAYGSYSEMLADPEIDAVYNPLPNHLHVDLTIEAAKAGKHVLCEKPMAMNAKDAERLRACPDDILISEAFMVRYHPQWHRALEIIRSGELGEIKAIRALFTYHNVDANNVRNMADIGGGGIMDIGCYAITTARYFFEGEPKRVVSLIDRDPNFKTDRTTTGIADFGNGRQLGFTISTQLVGAQLVEILGDKGRLEICVPYNAPTDTPTALIIDHGHSPDASLTRREIIPACDQYAEQAEAFAQAVLGMKPLAYGVEDAIKSMKVLDGLFESEKSGGWVSI